MFLETILMFAGIYFLLFVIDENALALPEKSTRTVFGVASTVFYFATASMTSTGDTSLPCLRLPDLNSRVQLSQRYVVVWCCVRLR
jgi:hypothetical protein